MGLGAHFYADQVPDVYTVVEEQSHPALISTAFVEIICKGVQDQLRLACISIIQCLVSPRNRMNALNQFMPTIAGLETS